MSRVKERISFLLTGCLLLSSLLMTPISIKAETISNNSSNADILNIDFEDMEAGEAPTGWSITESQSASMKVQEVEGNKVLALSSSDESQHVYATYALGDTYEKATLSYSFSMVKDSGFGYLLTPSNGGSIQSVTLGTNTAGNGSIAYTIDGSTWTKVQTKEDAVSEYGDFGKLETNHWYTVKIVYDKSNAATPVQVYLDGKLTNVQGRYSNIDISTISMQLTKWTYGNTFYIDNIRMTEEDHDLGFVSDGDILNFNFEGMESGAAPTGWSITESESASMKVQEVEGNKVLALSSSDESQHVYATYALGDTYEKATLSYSFSMVKDSGFGYLLTPSNGGSIQSVTLGTNTAGNGSIAYTIDGSTWTKVQTKEDAVSEYGDFGKLETNHWYTVKIVYDKSNAATPVQVYLDGKLTNVQGRYSNIDISTISMQLTKWTYGNTFYIDNIRMTVEDHDPEPVTEGDILNINFEDVESGAAPTGWSITESKSASMKVQEIKGNKVLALTGNDQNQHVYVTYPLERAYEKVTLSYSFYMANPVGTAYLLTTSNGGDIQNMTLGTNVGGMTIGYTTDGNAWTKIQTKADDSSEFEDFGGIETNHWYTVKIVYDKNNTTTPVQVYLDGKLTNVPVRYGAIDVRTISMQLTKWAYNNTWYIDNVRMTLGDHDPVLPVEVEPVAPESITFTTSAYQIPVGGHTYLEKEITPANAISAELVYESSDNDVVTVDEWGEIVAVAAGTATITVKAVEAPEVTATASVTVTPKTVMNSIYVSPNGSDTGTGTESNLESC